MIKVGNPGKDAQDAMRVHVHLATRKHVGQLTVSTCGVVGVILTTDPTRVSCPACLA